MKTRTSEVQAAFKTDDRKADRPKASLSIEGEGLTADSLYTVYIGDNTPFGVETDGFGDFNWEQKFAGVGRPTIATGTPLMIVDAKGTVTLKGSFSQK
jgi:hypothetical protein